MANYTHIRFPAITIAISLILLTGCGDSDLSELRRQKLDDARSAAQNQAAPVVDVANPVVNEPGTETDPVTDVPGSVDNPSVQEPNPTTGPAVGPTDGEPNPTTVPAPSGVDLTGYDLVFSDEFQGGQVDQQKWNTAFQWGPDLIINNEEQYYVDTQTNPDLGYDPFQFDGEVLTITASRTPSDLLSSVNNQPYLSGVLSSAEKFDLTYGYIEARVQLPAGNGLWPAFWMLGSEFVELKPQLFIFEFDGGRPDNAFVNYNYHDAEDNLRSPGQLQVPIENLTSGFHTFGVKWSPEELLYYIDGEPRYRIIGANVAAQDMYIIANMAIGGVWTGPADQETPFPAEYKIDYIRAYQRP